MRQDFWSEFKRSLMRLRLPKTVSVRPNPNRSGLAIVAIARDEARYLREWIEFHLMLGVRHVYLYDHGSADSTSIVVRGYERAGLLTRVAWASEPDTSPQIAAYADAIQRFGARWRWMAFIDIDEFLYPARQDSLIGVLDAHYGDAAGVEVRWRNFGFGGHLTRPGEPVIAAYTRRAVGPGTETRHLRKIKSIIDPTRVSAVIGAHSFRYRQGSMPKTLDLDAPIRLNHYFTRSQEEFQQKLGMPCVYWGMMDDPPDRLLNRRLEMVRLIEESTVEDRDMQRFVPALMQRLRSRVDVAAA